ncbi:MAG: hypothetical protein ACO2PN_28295 [Pyrobaculum sp.]
MKGVVHCKPWREFSRKFASPVNFYGWHVFERQHKLLVKGWRWWTCEQQVASS